MAMLQCAGCGMQKKDDGKSRLCPMCGGTFLPVEEPSPAPEKPEPKTPWMGMEEFYHPELLRAELNKLILPALENAGKILGVKKEMEKALQELTRTYPKSVFNILKDFSSQDMDNAWRKKESEDQVQQKRLRLGLEQYKQTLNTQYSGLGFSIITNSTASAAAYVGLAAFEEKKHRLKQEIAAATQLNETLRGLCGNGSDVGAVLLEGVERIVRTFTALREGYKFVSANRAFYDDPERNDPGLSLGGFSIFELLKEAAEGPMDFVGSYVQERKTNEKKDLAWVLPQLEGAGYIQYLQSPKSPDWRDRYITYYVTTGKFERMVLEQQYRQEHPVEAKLQDQEIQRQNEESYRAAEELLRGGKYYEAAVAFGKLEGYRDALQRSLTIWRERITPCTDHCVITDNFAITPTGNVLMPSEFPFPNLENWAKKNWEDLKNVRQFQNMGYGRYMAVDFRGNLWYCLETEVSVNYNCIDWKRQEQKNIVNFYARPKCAALLYEDGTVKIRGELDGNQVNLQHWKGIRKLEMYSDSLIGIRADGTVIGAGKCVSLANEYSRWKNVEQVKFFGEKYLFALTADGKVLAAGGEPENYDAVSGWSDIVDIVKASYCSVPLGLTRNGKVLWGSRTVKPKDPAVAHILGMRGIVAVSSTSGVLALKTDGTIWSPNLEKDYSKWENVVYIQSNYSADYALRHDGILLVAANATAYGQKIKKNEGWKLFSDVNTVLQERNQASCLALEEKLQKEKARLKGFQGLFSGARRQEIQANIASLEKRIAELKM